MDKPKITVLDFHGSSFPQDFPILCQTCLGENPYIRMVSEHPCVFIANSRLFSCSVNNQQMCKSKYVHALFYRPRKNMGKNARYFIFFSLSR